ncbi:MAG: FtsX-like permease family protein [Cyclobacteriaceae bacterium]
MTYDQFNQEHEKIYRLSYYRQVQNGDIVANATSGTTWGPRYKEIIPEVENYTRLSHSGYPGYINIQGDVNAFMEPLFYWVDDNFLDVFYFPLKSGNRRTVFQDMNSVVISETSAKKYFGEEDPIGQVMEFTHNVGKISLTVTGVMHDPPGNSHIKPTFLAPMMRYSEEAKKSWSWDMINQDGDSFAFTYIKVSDTTALSKIRKDWLAWIPQVLANVPNRQPDAYKDVKFTALSQMHFEPEMKWELEAPANANLIPIFTITAFLVLLVACINFMNLATARSAKRAKEVGLRKTLGSTKRQLIFQFYGESFLITILSVLISYVMAILFLSSFNELTGKTIAFQSLYETNTLLILLGLSIFVGLISGSYPALYLSSFKPMAALRGLFTSGKGAERTRQSLVIFQFGISIVLIISTMVVLDQLSLINTSKLGKEKDRILSIRLGGFGLGNSWITFRDQIEQDSRFENVTLGNHLPRLPHFGLINGVFWFPERDNESMEWNKFDVDFNFPATFDLEFLAGRDFNSDIRSDTNAVILNEAAARNLQQSPQDVIGMTIRDQVWSNQLQQQVDLDGKVIGVVRDFPYKSVNTAIEPLTIWGRPHRIDRIMYVKMTPGDLPEKIAYLQEKWQEVNPGFPMENWFLDYEFGRLYENERRISTMFILFSCISIFIAVLGLFALTSYVTEQRKKEIGVRKVLGATNGRLVWLLMTHFLRLIVIAFVLGAPLAWYLMNDWLDGFVYRVEVSPFIMIISALTVTTITLLTVGYDAYKSASANPVRSLRSG